MPKKYLGALLGVLALAVAGFSGLALAKTGKGPNHKFGLTFVNKKGKAVKKTKSAVGVKLTTDRYNYVPQAPGQQANPVTKIVFRLAAGSKLNLGVIPSSNRAKCTSTALGSAGDPAAAGCVAIGSGDAVTSLGGLPQARTILEDATIYAATQQLLVRLRPKPGQTGQTVNLYINVKGRTLTANVPTLCAVNDPRTPFCDAEVVLTKLTATVRPRTRGKRTLIRTPRKCGKSRRWKNTASYTFRNGGGEKVTSTSRCTRPRKR